MINDKIGTTTINRQQHVHNIRCLEIKYKSLVKSREVTEALVRIKNKSCTTADLSRTAEKPAGQHSRWLVSWFKLCLWGPFMHLQLHGCLVYSMFASDAFGEAAAFTAAAY